MVTPAETADPKTCQCCKTALFAASSEDARAAGFRRVELMAMLSGHAMYLATGYRDVASADAKLEDGAPFR